MRDREHENESGDKEKRLEREKVSVWRMGDIEKVNSKERKWGRIVGRESERNGRRMRERMEVGERKRGDIFLFVIDGCVLCDCGVMLRTLVVVWWWSSPTSG